MLRPKNVIPRTKWGENKKLVAPTLFEIELDCFISIFPILLLIVAITRNIIAVVFMLYLLIYL